MSFRPVVSVPLLLALLAFSGLLPGCSSSKDKGTNVQVAEPFESNDLPSGGVFVHRFNAAGTFSYRCRIHGSMTGTITVAAAGEDSVFLQISDFAFQAPSSAVRTGGYVKWTNIGTTHTVTRP